MFKEPEHLNLWWGPRGLEIPVCKVDFRSEGVWLDNAMKYSKDKIDVFIEKDVQHAIMQVKDYGIGIPQGEINNIFERFYRVDKARTRKTEGSGLGLSIANNIMKLHKGKIKIASKEGTGTTVELFLPIININVEG